VERILQFLTLIKQIADWEIRGVMETMYYSGVDESPSYRGGYKKLNQIIQNHTCHFDREVNAVVWISIVIESDGKVSDKKIARSSNFADIDNEALRLVDFLTEWNPGKSHGKPVTCHWYFPIKIKQQ
jgi:TonB family protein